MKKIFYILGSLTVLAVGLAGCSDTLEERYLNPERTTEASVQKLFTGLLDNNRVRPQYWEIRTFAGEHTAKYTQTLSFVNASRRYQVNDGYMFDRWSDFYTQSGNGSGLIAQYREMEKIYAAASDNEKAKLDVFMKAGRVFLLDQTTQMVDLWGDIPFSEAGSLNSSGSLSLAKFDDAQTIYMDALTELKAIADDFATRTLEADVQNMFTAQDLLMGGSLQGWKRYVNSLRLRLLMRISFVEEARAREEVLEILSTPGTYPLVDQSQYNVMLEPLTTYTGDLRNALTEASAYAAPEFMLDEVLKPVSDPRIRVLFDKGVTRAGVPNADYYSLPIDATSEAQSNTLSQGNYAPLDSATFIINPKLPGLVIGAAEVNLLKAEAYERWGSTSDAQASYEAGVAQSIDYYFMLNARGNGDEEAPDAVELADFWSHDQVAYTGTTAEKLEKIWTQKWLNFGFLQSLQAWAEMRRTGYPDLTFVPDESTPAFLMPPTGRLLYPSNEVIYNAANYEAVAPEDEIGTRIFWAID